MITVKVLFDFDTKEEWIEFGNKFFNQKEFIKYSSIGKELQKRNHSFSDVVEHFFKNDSSIWLNCYNYIDTKSEKVLKKVYEFIKENHYENNYQLRDNWGNKLRMDFDELFELWSDIKSNRCNNK